MIKDILKIAIWLLWSAPLVQAQTTRFVKPIASGSGNGLSWSNASNDVQAAINASAQGDAVWIAVGTYKPTQDPFGNSAPTDPRNKTFYIKDGVKIYGGFAGTETDLTQRNLMANPTILSGDFNSNDVVSGSGNTLSITNNTDNAYHVVLTVASAGTGIGVTIDGFTIRGGNASRVGSGITVNTIQVNAFVGGGIYAINGTNTLTNNTFTANVAINEGGGLFTFAGTNTLLNNTFLTNAVSSTGGAIYFYAGTNALTNNTIVGNSAYSGGGVYLDMGTNTLTHNLFCENSGNYGGAIETYAGTNAFFNNTFYANLANSYGGAIYTVDGTNRLTNNLFWGNQKSGSSTALGSDYYANATNGNTFKNNLLQLASSNYPVSATGNYALGAAASGNLFARNPLWVNAADIDGQDNFHRTGDDGLRLQASSPAVNAGISVAGVTSDIVGNFYLGNPDIGAYEIPCLAPTAYDMTGGGVYCVGGSGVEVGLAHSETGMKYQLIKDGVNVGSLIAGTGTALSFGNQMVTGTYTILATNPVGNCSTPMATEVVVTLNPLPTANIVVNNFCGNSVLTLTTTGMFFNWSNGATTQNLTVSTAGTYTVTVTVPNAASCTITANGAAAPKPLPTATVIPASATTFCQGNQVILNANTGTGLTYQWKQNGAIISNATQANYTASTTGNYTVVVTNANGCNNTSATTAVIVNSLPTATITKIGSTTLCQGNQVILNANAGTGFSYQWQLNGSNIQNATQASYTTGSAGAYSVVVTTANNCVATSTVTTVSVNPSPLLVTRNLTPILCNGGTSQVTIGSDWGTPPFQYSLNGLNYQPTAIFDLTAGTRRIWVRDANNCTDSLSSVTVTQPSLLTISAPTAALLNCADGQTNLQSVANGGTLPHQYSLDGVTYQAANVFSVQGGTYQIFVRDANGCRATSSSYQVVRPAALVVTVAVNPIKCWGDTTDATIQVSNASAPIQYTLNGVIQLNNNLYKGLRIGNYAVQVSDNRGCRQQTTFSLTQPPLLTGSIIADTLICKGKKTPITVYTSGGTGQILYSLNNGTFQNNLPLVGGGTYTVQIRDANQCLKTLPTVKIKEITASINVLQQVPLNCFDNNMRIYPNPVVDVLAVDFKINTESAVRLLVYNVLGQPLAEMDYATISAGNYTTAWHTTNWASNVVWVCLEVDGKFVQVSSVLVVH